MKSRGIRNNNPGNIRRSNTKWVGQSEVQTDSQFVQFDSMEYGVRAMAKVLLTYYNKYGLNNIKAIISRWAPTNENNTSGYIRRVSNDMMTGAEIKIDLTDEATMRALCSAIISVECADGIEPYVIDKGVKMALQ